MANSDVFLRRSRRSRSGVGYGIGDPVTLLRRVTERGLRPTSVSKRSRVKREREGKRKGEEARAREEEKERKERYDRARMEGRRRRRRREGDMTECIEGRG